MMQNTPHSDLKQLTQDDFLSFGVDDVAYVRPFQDAVGIFAADGTKIAVMADFDVACAAVRQNGMEPMTVH
ncbi:DUF1150 family protein [Fodinicurvata sediminis]|uniref:DUF1150 family protein n=1 Tax=Fodinicurvata sediminis TaxID=1121832 RepID=UPI0003B5F753|nr:DUF1150 family protein [Fodinicurvata sediminis]